VSVSYGSDEFLLLSACTNGGSFMIRNNSNTLLVETEDKESEQQ